MLGKHNQNVNPRQIFYIALHMIKPPSPLETDPWMLDPEITYLNHGSFGARPVPVYEAQERYKRQFEASPIDFLDRNRTEKLEAARQVVATFLGADPAGFGFVENATTGIGCVIQSIELQQGDEMLTTTHVYNGVRMLMQHRATQVGCTYRELELPLPIHDAASITNAVLQAITPATKLLVIDHISSSSSLIFPIEDIIKGCHARDVMVLVDGAHGPGMLDLQIDAIGADWYVGNLHKWVCAPLGAGFVWTDKDHRETTHPMTVSHFLSMSYKEEFDWQGTRDISPWLTAADAVKWGDSIGWDSIRTHNHSMAVWMQERLVEAWGVEPLSPLDGSLIGNMATVQLPVRFLSEMEACITLRDEIYLKHHLEIHIVSFLNLAVVRVSGQLYTKGEDIEALIKIIKKCHA
jgi:isopenicillin-N epimerase